MNRSLARSFARPQRVDLLTRPFDVWIYFQRSGCFQLRSDPYQLTRKDCRKRRSRPPSSPPRFASPMFCLCKRCETDARLVSVLSSRLNTRIHQSAFSTYGGIKSPFLSVGISRPPTRSDRRQVIIRRPSWSSACFFATQRTRVRQSAKTPTFAHVDACDLRARRDRQLKRARNGEFSAFIMTRGAGKRDDRRRRIN